MLAPEPSERVQRVARAVDADGDALVLVTGERLVTDAVVWATGHRPHYPWLHVPVLDESGAPVHVHGVTDVPGLAFLGLPWQRSRDSALLGGVGRDAAELADVLGGQLRASSSTSAVKRGARHTSPSSAVRAAASSTRAAAWS